MKQTCRTLDPADPAILKIVMSDRPDEKHPLLLDLKPAAVSILENIEKLEPFRNTFENSRKIIALCGPSGSGKSTMASLLAFLLMEKGRHPYVMSGDNYPHLIPKENDERRARIFESEGKKGLENYLGTQNEIDLERVSSILKAFRQGKPEITLRRMGKLDPESEESIYEENVDFSNIDTLIIEWTHAGNESLNPVDARVFLSVSKEESEKRRARRGRDANFNSPLIQNVLKIEAEKLDRQKENCDLIFDEQMNLQNSEEDNQICRNDPAENLEQIEDGQSIEDHKTDKQKT